MSFLRAMWKSFLLKAPKQPQIWLLTKQIDFCEEEATLKLPVALG